VEETVLDLAPAAATFDEVCGWVTRAFARDLTDGARLRAAMGRRTRLRWRADLHELIAAAASGDHSMLEYRYGRDVVPQSECLLLESPQREVFIRAEAPAASQLGVLLVCYSYFAYTFQAYASTTFQRINLTGLARFPRLASKPS
jgi:hypothetical protein